MRNSTIAIWAVALALAAVMGVRAACRRRRMTGGFEFMTDAPYRSGFRGDATTYGRECVDSARANPPPNEPVYDPQACYGSAGKKRGDGYKSRGQGVCLRGTDGELWCVKKDGNRRVWDKEAGREYGEKVAQRREREGRNWLCPKHTFGSFKIYNSQYNLCCMDESGDGRKCVFRDCAGQTQNNYRARGLVTGKHDGDTRNRGLCCKSVDSLPETGCITANGPFRWANMS